MRRPGWRPGLPIRLADGQDWAFRLPRAVVRRARWGPFASLTLDGPPATDDALVAELNTWDRAQGRERDDSAAAVGFALLLSNYHVSGSDYLDLIGGESGPERERLAAEFAKLARRCVGSCYALACELGEEVVGAMP